MSVLGSVGHGTKYEHSSVGVIRLVVYVEWPVKFQAWSFSIHLGISLPDMKPTSGTLLTYVNLLYSQNKTIQ
jgi:hypothetical protein